MTFHEFLDEILKVKCEETRTRTADYLEVVISRKDFKKLEPVLEAYFGPALKPEGQRPSGEANRYSMPYGGIRQDQILYFRKGEQGFAVAMIWPWGNGTSLTVKIIREQEDVPQEKKSFLGGLFGR